jgi:SM-20-related protein
MRDGYLNPPPRGQTDQIVKPSVINLDKVDHAKLEISPFEYIVVSDFIRDEWKDKLIENYPKVKGAGSFALPSLSCTSEFMQLINEMNAPAFKKAIERKFSLDLDGKPSIFTVRGRCRLRDGKVHTDSESKIITALLYMNPAWENQGGRLRLLNSLNIDDIKTEISPIVGTLLVFKRTDHSFHGHLPFEGPRKVIQMNWVTHQKFVDQEHKRHRWSALFKIFLPSY